MNKYGRNAICNVLKRKMLASFIPLINWAKTPINVTQVELKSTHRVENGKRGFLQRVRALMGSPEIDVPTAHS